MNPLAQRLAQTILAASLSGALVAAVSGCRDTNVSIAGAGRGGGGGQTDTGGRGDAAPMRDAGTRADAQVADDCSAASNLELAWGQLHWELTGIVPGASRNERRYEGWVAIERSTAHELVMAVPLTAASDEDAGVPDTASVAHIAVSTERDLPRFALGSRAWMLISDDADYGGIPRRRAGSQLSVRAAQGGALLLGTFQLPDPSADALTVREPQELCSTPSRCFSDGRDIGYSLEVAGDSPVRLSPGTHAEVSFAGAKYDVGLYRATRTTGSTADQCVDGVQDDRLWVHADVLAVEPDAITSRLEHGVLARCKLGNDAGVWIDHSVYEHAVSDVIDGEVTYRGKMSEELQFDLVGGEGALGIRARDWPLPEPSPGQSFWLSSTFWYFVLRESQAGQVLLASGALSVQSGGDVDAASVELVSRWLGTPLSVERECLYEPAHGGFNDPSAPAYLYRVRFGDASVASGQTARVSLGGAAYDVWVSTQGANIPLTIQRVP